ncbi:hypothetical protein FQR65_LT08815 [Abscondita terminalis]|nr:hypothetical protein FQR65_LT08815 [Abscondita terminalis]
MLVAYGYQRSNGCDKLKGIEQNLELEEERKLLNNKDLVESFGKTEDEAIYMRWYRHDDDGIPNHVENLVKSNRELIADELKKPLLNCCFQKFHNPKPLVEKKFDVGIFCFKYDDSTIILNLISLNLSVKGVIKITIIEKKKLLSTLVCNKTDKLESKGVICKAQCNVTREIISSSEDWICFDTNVVEMKCKVNLFTRLIINYGTSYWSGN